MRVIHVSTSSSGGSWTSAQKLVEAQRISGLDSEIITLEQLQTTKSGSLKHIRKFSRKLNTLYSTLIAKNQYEFLSIFSTSAGLLSYLDSEKPDLIHIHNWFNILSLRELKQIGKKFPVVFTMHDSRIATGGCHIPYGCTNYINTCKKCPAVKLNRNQVARSRARTLESITSIGHYAIIAPSQWMLSQAIRSGVTVNSKASLVIPNVCTDEFVNSGEIKFSNSLSLVFVAANLNSRTKGLDVLLGAANSKLLEGTKIELHLIGANFRSLQDKSTTDTKIIVHGFLSNDETKKIMRNSDLLIVPSSSENFPNVILEAMSQGLVVVASSVGGIPEMVTHEKNGYLYNGSEDALAEAILNALRNKPKWHKIRDEAQERIKNEYSVEKTLDSTSLVYTDLIKSYAARAFK